MGKLILTSSGTSQFLNFKNYPRFTPYMPQKVPDSVPKFEGPNPREREVKSGKIQGHSLWGLNLLLLLGGL